MTLLITPALCATMAALVAKAGADLPRRNRREGLAHKADGSVVTAADVATEQTLRQLIAPHLPGVSIIGEETSACDGILPDDAMVALIDPLDGTAAYADGRDDYSVNAALIDQGAPVLGILGLPAQRRVLGGIVTAAQRAAWCWQTDAEGTIIGAPAPIAVRSPSTQQCIGLVSERHGDEESEKALKRAGTSARLAASSACKFALIAEGRGHLYPRYGATMAWDTAAGQGLLEAAGGCVISPDDGTPLRYQAGQPLRNGPFIAASDEKMARRAAGLV